MIVAGTNGTGKTTFAEKLISTLKKPVIVIDPDGMEKTWQKYPTIEKSDIYYLQPGKKVRIIYDDDDKTFFEMLRTIKNSAIIFDDAMFFLEDRKNENFRKLFIRRRQLNNDIIFICHGLSEIPPSFWTFATHLVLFKTRDGFERSKKNIPNFETVKNGIFLVNEKAKNNHYHKEIISL